MEWTRSKLARLSYLHSQGHTRKTIGIMMGLSKGMVARKIDLMDMHKDRKPTTRQADAKFKLAMKGQRYADDPTLR